ncbi:arsenate reductase (glutaredoxin) [Isoalcanivorax indicus]|uniref:arsenate reductase (glutaredoxin) n=1 Tax=Isoalcanivorax indicus TaxID=2202653 RepID=UPI000DB98E78|nr:arsenate reductase (glutaredoxin) [Isoalcanivorax indicus]
MADYRIYHNPRCSKSRQTLALLEEQGISPQVILYLQTPPDAATLKRLVKQLGMAHPHELLRKGEAEYREAGLSPDSPADTVLNAMVRYPKLIERPIVVHGQRAVLGRPPENVLDLMS